MSKRKIIVQILLNCVLAVGVIAETHKTDTYLNGDAWDAYGKFTLSDPENHEWTTRRGGYYEISCEVH